MLFGHAALLNFVQPTKEIAPVAKAKYSGAVFLFNADGGQEQVIRGDPYYGDYFISSDLYEQLRSCEVKAGDILVSLVGTAGKVLVLPDDCASGIINPRLLKLSLHDSGVNPKFIKILLESATTRAFFKLAAHGGTMEILNLGILKSLPVALPPLAEQSASSPKSSAA